MPEKPCKKRAQLEEAVANAIKAVFVALDGEESDLAKARMAESKALAALDRHKKEHGCG